MTSDTVLSADGTTIVFDVEGSDFRPVVLRADGAATHRAMDPERAEFTRRLADPVRVVSYDRRRRGGRGDRDAYAERLRTEIDSGRPGAAMKLFMTEAVEMPNAMVDGMTDQPFWPALEHVAPTFVYDAHVMGEGMQGQPEAIDAFSDVSVPSPVMNGTASEVWLRKAAALLAELLPNGDRHGTGGTDTRCRPPSCSPTPSARASPHSPPQRTSHDMHRIQRQENRHRRVPHEP